MDKKRAKILPDEERETPRGRQMPLFPVADIVVRDIMGLWDTWATERRTKEATWLECEMAYLSQHINTPGVAKWKSKAYIPASFNAVEKIHAQLMSGAFPPDFFDIVPLDEEYEHRADIVKELLQQQLSTSGFRAEFAHFIKQLIVIGNSAAVVDWDADNNTSRFKALDMKYFHVDPFAGEPHRANKIRKYWLTHEEAEALGIFDKKALEQLEHAQRGASTATTEDSNRTAAAQAAGLQTGLDPKRGEIEVTEFWGTIEIGEETYKNVVISIGNGSVVLRNEKSPYLHGKDPFVFTRYNVVAGEVYGIGALEPALPLQYLINTFTNQKVDELSLLINGVYKYVDDGTIDVENLVNVPGGLFEVGDINNLEPLMSASSVALAYTELADLERKFEEATGAINLVVGGAQNTNDRTTATEVMALTQSGNARFNETLAHIEVTALVPALRKYTSNAVQFMKKPITAQIIGVEDMPEWVTIKGDSIKGQFDIKAGGSRLVGVRELRLRNLMQYVQVVGQLPEVAQRVDWEKVDRKLWRELGFDDDDSVMRSEEEMQILAASNPQQPQAQPQAANPLDQLMGGMENVNG